METLPPGRRPYPPACKPYGLEAGPEAGFSVHNRVRVARDDEQGREALAQYIIRNTFSVEKLTLLNRCPPDNLTGLTYIEATATVIYRSKPVLNLIQ